MKHMKLQLGVIYHNDKIINHRSLLKVLLNPLLRFMFGYHLTSLFVDEVFAAYKLEKCTRFNSIRYEPYELSHGMWVRPYRRIF